MAYVFTLMKSIKEFDWWFSLELAGEKNDRQLFISCSRSDSSYGVLDSNWSEVQASQCQWKGSVSKLIGFVRVALLIGWVVFYYILQKNDFAIKSSPLWRAKHQLAAVISYELSLNWRSNFRKRNSVPGLDWLRYGVMFWFWSCLYWLCKWLKNWQKRGKAQTGSF